jgi:hypothetical protein
VEKAQRQYADKLAQHFPLYAVVEQPVRPSNIAPLLVGSDPSEEATGDPGAK